MRDPHITHYLKSHLAELLTVVNVVNQLCQKESSLELHRFFTRLQMEMGEDPRALKQLLFGLGEEARNPRDPSQNAGEGDWLRLSKTGLDPKDPELFAALEWLALEIQSKALMWKTLAAVSSTMPEWRGIDFKSREQKAKNQRDRIESVRLVMASEILRGN